VKCSHKRQRPAREGAKGGYNKKTHSLCLGIRRASVWGRVLGGKKTQGRVCEKGGGGGRGVKYKKKGGIRYCKKKPAFLRASVVDIYKQESNKGEENIPKHGNTTDRSAREAQMF